MQNLDLYPFNTCTLKSSIHDAIKSAESVISKHPLLYQECITPQRSTHSCTFNKLRGTVKLLGLAFNPYAACTIRADPSLSLAPVLAQDVFYKQVIVNLISLDLSLALKRCNSNVVLPESIVLSINGLNISNKCEYWPHAISFKWALPDTFLDWSPTDNKDRFALGHCSTSREVPGIILTFHNQQIMQAVVTICEIIHKLVLYRFGIRLKLKYSS
jgi:hypothetical protein